MDFIDRKEFRGAIQDQIEEAHQFVLRHTNKGAVIDGLYRQDVYELPVSAIREIIVNAVLHRSYVDQASIQVSIFDDRLEIDSPGMLYAGLSVTDALSGKSKCRNKAIAEAFQYMKIIEGWGTGLPRLFRRCKEMGLPEPQFEEFGDGIKVTVYRVTDNMGNNRESNDRLNESNRSNNQSNESNRSNNQSNEWTVSERIIALIKENPSISQRKLATEIGVARSTIEVHMANLKEAGKVTREGGTRGIWVFLERD